MKHLIFTLAACSLFMACGGSSNEPESPDGPAEETAEEVDEATHEATEAVEEGAEEAGDALEEAGDEVEEATD